jgi:hypothetical protein
LTRLAIRAVRGGWRARLIFRESTRSAA